MQVLVKMSVFGRFEEVTEIQYSSIEQHWQQEQRTAE
jgi:hypothetical protein